MFEDSHLQILKRTSKGNWKNHLSPFLLRVKVMEGEGVYGGSILGRSKDLELKPNLFHFTHVHCSRVNFFPYDICLFALFLLWEAFSWQGTYFGEGCWWIDEPCAFHNKEFVSNVRDDKGIWMCVQKCHPGGICSRWHFLIVLNFILFIVVCLLFRSQGIAKRCVYVKVVWI